jgi:predicted ATP-grasp superfamily ATP-dependent carboligase
VSVYRESIAPDADLLDRSRALLDRFAWTGVAMVEYKRDVARRRDYLMEINGRFWGSLQLAIDAGVDFPRLLVEAALGAAPGPVPAYRVGVRSRWWWGQVDHLIALIRRPQARRAAPLYGALAQMLGGPFRAGDREEVLRWGDPRPFVRETMLWIRGR